MSKGSKNNAKLSLLKATENDSLILTSIAFEAKSHWNYPEHYFKDWKKELTITNEYIINNWVYKANFNTKTVGFCSLVNNPNDFYSGEVLVKKGLWLEHIFILPDYHHLGIGSALMEEAKKKALRIGAKELFVFVDPYAIGFYEKQGAKFLYYSNSSIHNRKIPVYSLNLK